MLVAKGRSSNKLQRAHYRRDRAGAKEYLRTLGVSKDLLARWRLIWVFTSLVALAVVVIAFADDADQNRVEWAISAVVAVGLLIGGYVEWTLARREASLDKFYERLCIANESNEKLKDCELPNAGQIRLKNTTLQLYVYREIDNLEYVLERYRHGFLDAVLAARGIQTFASRLKVQDFRLALADLGDLAAKAAYLHTTSELIRILLVRVPPPEAAAPGTPGVVKAGTSALEGGVVAPAATGQTALPESAAPSEGSSVGSAR